MAHPSKPVDLLSLCHRAIGEWQNLDVHQGLIANVEYNLALKDVGNLCVELKKVKAPSESESKAPDLKFDTSDVPASYLDSLDCTRVTTGEIFENVPTGGVPKRSFHTQNILTWNSRKESGLKIALQKQRIMKKAHLDSLSEPTREALFWALRFKTKDFVIVPAILEIARALKQKNFKSWILPNGMVVPLDSLRMRVLEVAPSNWYVFRTMSYLIKGDKREGNHLVPNLMLCPQLGDVTRATPIHRYDEKLGFVVTHAVLEVEFCDACDLRNYIIDPTSMQHGYRGPNQTVIAHGEYWSYVKNFPGVVGNTVTEPRSDFATVRQEIYFLGEGKNKFVSRLVRGIALYWARRSCAYCGTLEGEHQKEGRYTFCKLAHGECGRCRAIVYCAKMCQHLDWKNHREKCVEAFATITITAGKANGIEAPRDIGLD